MTDRTVRLLQQFPQAVAAVRVRSQMVEAVAVVAAAARTTLEEQVQAVKETRVVAVRASTLAVVAAAQMLLEETRPALVSAVMVERVQRLPGLLTLAAAAALRLVGQITVELAVVVAVDADAATRARLLLERKTLVAAAVVEMMLAQPRQEVAASSSSVTPDRKSEAVEQSLTTAHTRTTPLPLPEHTQAKSWHTLQKSTQARSSSA